MRSILLICLILCMCCLSCVSTKPGYDRKTVLWVDEMKKLDACETYEQFQGAATSLGFYFKADEKKDGIRILTYTRDVYLAAKKRSHTQVLGFWINYYIPRVTFSTPHTIYPFYNRDFKTEALRKGFELVSGTDENYTMIRLSDQAKFTMTEEYYSNTGVSVYTVMF